MRNLEKICLGCMREKPSAGGACPYCGFDAQTYEKDSRWLPPGYILNGKYLLGKMLGEGGFGITYIGWDLNLAVRVAIKEYFPIGLATRELGASSHYSLSSLRGEKRDSYKNGLKKFVEEAQSLSRFYHLDGIVAVKELFFENETAYMVMEYLDGVTLKEYLKKHGGRLSVEETLRIMEPVLRSLAEVHKAGIIHRDISTDNIMITREGKTKLIDFGSARTWDIGGNKTFTIVLKHGYAPPEQYQTKGKQGAWTDIYAASATIYRMITGQLPPNSMDRFGGDTLQSFAQLGCKVPDYIEEAVVKRGLALRAEQRYATVEELVAALYPREQEKEKPMLFTKPAIAAGITVFILLLLAAGAFMPQKNKAPEKQTLLAEAGSEKNGQQTEKETETERHTEKVPETETVRAAETETEPQTEKETETERAVETETETTRAAETEPQTEKVTETVRAAKTETETATDALAEPQTESETATDAIKARATDTERESETETAAGGSGTQETESESETKAAEAFSIDEENFPDEIFRAYVQDELDRNKDGWMSQKEISEVRKIDVNSMNIQSLKGVKLFPKLQNLNCSSNQLEELDVSRNTELERLNCSSNQLEVLDVSQNTKLERLDCSYNQQKVLDVSQNTKLEKLDCDSNQLEALDVTDNTEFFIIDKTKFPDEMFRKYVQDELDRNKDGWMSQKEIARAREIDVNSMNIQSLKGVELFPKLRNLNCSTNQLKELDVSRNTELEELNCCRNKLKAVDVSQNTKLEWLVCWSNQLEVLDVSQNTELEWLSCGFDQVEELDMSQNTKLKWLDCSNGRLKALDISQNTKLERLDCGTNQLEVLDVTNNTELKEIDCRTNKIKALDVSQNKKLTNLNCKENQLTSLDVSQNVELKDLICGSNRLTSLDVSQNEELTGLICGSNRLTSLDLSQNKKLFELYCYDNDIYELDISQNPRLSSLWWDYDQLMAMDRDRISGMSIQYGKNGSSLNLR